MTLFITIKRLVLVASAVFALVLVAACGQAQRPEGTRATVAPTIAPASATLPTIGERAEAAGVALTIKRVERMAALNEDQVAGAGREYAVADVLIENTSSQNKPYSPFDFTVKDTSGVESQGVVTINDGSLFEGTLTPGDTVRGTVAFKVAKGATLRLTYAPVAGGRGLGLRIDLGQ